MSFHKTCIACVLYIAKLSQLTILALTFASSIWARTDLRVGILGEYTPTHPLLSSFETNDIVQSLTLLPLISLEKKWTWQCRLCTQVPTQANRGIELFTDKIGLTKLAIHMELPPNAHWADGEPLTVKDLVFTWQVMQRVPSQFRTTPALLEIEDVITRPKEQHHFTIILRSLCDPYPVLNSFVVLSHHLDQKHFENDKTAYFTNSLYVQNPNQVGLYSGPYHIQSQGTNSVSLVRNSSVLYPAKISNLNLQFFASLRTMTEALQHRNIDLVENLPVWNEVFNLVQNSKLIEDFYRLVPDDTFYFEHIDFNLQNPIFQDPNVRKALTYAIDKEFILRTLLKDWGIPAVSPVHPSDRYFSENIAFYEYSPTKARKLLAHSDWTPGADGIRTKRTRALAFEIQCADDPLRLQIAQYLVRAWKEVGAQVNIRSFSLPEFRERIAKRNYSGATLYSWELPPLKSKKTLFHSASIPSLSNHYSGQNISGWINAKVDESLTKIRMTLNDSDRKNWLTQFQQEYTAELPSIPLFFRSGVSFVPKDLQSFSTPMLSRDFGLTAATWQ